MAIAPIAPFAPISIGGPSALGGAGLIGSAPSAGGSFADTLTKALDDVAGANAEVDRLSVQAATGDLGAAHDLTIATSEAQLLTQLTVEVRNRAVEAFNDIMRMQV
jgi:flagellar hook-basal body complex protein FliE